MIKNLFNCQKCKDGIECEEHKNIHKKDGSNDDHKKKVKAIMLV